MVNADVGLLTNQIRILDQPGLLFEKRRSLMLLVSTMQPYDYVYFVDLELKKSTFISKLKNLQGFVLQDAILDNDGVFLTKFKKN